MMIVPTGTQPIVPKPGTTFDDAQALHQAILNGEADPFGVLARTATDAMMNHRDIDRLAERVDQVQDINERLRIVLDDWKRILTDQVGTLRRIRDLSADVCLWSGIVSWASYLLPNYRLIKIIRVVGPVVTALSVGAGVECDYLIAKLTAAQAHYSRIRLE